MVSYKNNLMCKTLLVYIHIYIYNVFAEFTFSVHVFFHTSLKDTFPYCMRFLHFDKHTKIFTQYLLCCIYLSFPVGFFF